LEAECELTAEIMPDEEIVNSKQRAFHLFHRRCSVNELVILPGFLEGRIMQGGPAEEETTKLQLPPTPM